MKNKEKEIYLAGGCFWGLEKYIENIPGVLETQVGFANGKTENPSYVEVCRRDTGHAETVRVIYDSEKISLLRLLSMFYKVIDPTSLNRQGNDVGTQYRSVIHCQTRAQYDMAIASRAAYQQRLRAAGLGDITTEIVFPAPAFYYAEDEHQQYLAKNPMGYCGIGGTGVSCAVGLEA
jgi:peptide-methionine (S)-S-oxide reductase